jgi:predicted peptidase
MTVSCSGPEKNRVTDTFDPADRPYFTFNSEKNYFFLEPWNYRLPQNEQIKYPLVIFLHGSGGAGDISYLNYLGYDKPGDGFDDPVALKFQQEHPSFVVVPQTSSSWDNPTLIGMVGNIISSYRIDTRRIYLIGYSMGGSGSYSFANALYDYNGQLFAGIIRLAGQSQTVVRDSIAAKTAIWLHIGLEDLEERIRVTREAYLFLKNYFPGAAEIKSAVTIPGHPGNTYSLIINNDDRIKMTEYDSTGHDIVLLPFKDNYLIEWLFKHNL